MQMKNSIIEGLSSICGKKINGIRLFCFNKTNNIYLLVYNILFLILSDSIPLKDVIYTECKLKLLTERRTV